MTTDRYTKAVLTIIALCLSIIAIKMTTKDAHAQQQAFKFSRSGALIVTICDANGNGYSFNCADVEKLERK
jgi:glucose uptake protein GlcU